MSNTVNNNPKEIIILQLYPEDMNIYGDQGNVLVLQRRLEWYGYQPRVISYNLGDTLPKDVDIVIGGGGQDSGQLKIHTDLLTIGPSLHHWAEAGVPMLLVCGLYQLFGHSFQTFDGTQLKGIEIFDAKTYGTHERLIGNIITTSSEFGEIIGYENHSGQTYLGKSATALATVVRGAGNNIADGLEGARMNNVIGTYLHGSILPKNPTLADFLITTAIRRRYGEFHGTPIDDSLAEMARRVARTRPR